MSNNNLVTEEQVEEALTFLRESAIELGAARKQMIATEKYTKHRQALLMQRYSNLPVSAQEREARANKQYWEDSSAEAEAAGDFEVLKAKREAAVMTIEAWRSMNANYRSMKL